MMQNRTRVEIGGYHVGILTCCGDDWGGSEELWAKSIPHLQGLSCTITAYKSKFNISHPQIKSLECSGVVLKDLAPSYSIHKRIGRQLHYLYNRMVNRNYHQESHFHLVSNLKEALKGQRPDIMVISQGINFDGLVYAYECLKLGIPYIIICQKAVDFFWPQTHDKSFMKQTFENARLVCFVSRHNKELTEEQFGFRFQNSRIVFNPVKIRRQFCEFPSSRNGFRLACVARLFLIDKGQDILIKVMAQKKWRERPISISLIGAGADAKNIQELINLFQLNNVKVDGIRDNMEGFWKDFHALILPSRSEGLPLAIIEAMAVGRPVIAANAGGNAEIVKDGITGFVGEPTVRAFDEAMERAWADRHRWDELGYNAFTFVQQNIPVSPEKDFAKLIHSQLC